MGAFCLDVIYFIISGRFYEGWGMMRDEFCTGRVWCLGGLLFIYLADLEGIFEKRIELSR